MKSRHQQSKGTTAVEVAICLPILFLFLFASYEISRANFLSHAAESAAYEGARVGILPGANKVKIEKAVDFVMRSCGASDYRVNVQPAVIGVDTPKVTVHVDVPMRDNSTMIFRFLKDPVFRGKCTMNRERL